MSRRRKGLEEAGPGDRPDPHSAAGIEVERYEFDEAAPYSFEVERRDFLRIVGGGIVVAATLPRLNAQESGRGGAQGRTEEASLAAWLHIDEQGKVTVYTGKTEIGQNIRTSLAQAVADELRLPLDSITMVMADTTLVPFDAGTFGSQSTPRMSRQLSRAAATARDLLLERAAAEWRVDRTAVSVKDGKIVGPGGRATTYGSLTKGQKLSGVVAGEPSVTPVSEWTLRGTAPRKVNGRDIVTGAHRFTPDIHRPGMLHGRIVRPSGDGRVACLAGRCRRPKAAECPGGAGWRVRRRGCAERASGTACGRGGHRTVAHRAWTTNVGQHLRAPDQAGHHRTSIEPDEQRGCRRGVRQGGEDLRRTIPHPLHRACAAGAARVSSGVDRWTAHCLDGDAASVRCPLRARVGVPNTRGARAGHRSGLWIGIRRQAFRRTRDRGGAPGAGVRQAGEAGMDARRGVRVGVLPSRGGDRRQGSGRSRRADHRVGLHQLQLWCGGDTHALCDPQPAHHLPWIRLPSSPGFLPRARGHRQPLRPRDADGRDGAGAGRGRGRLPAPSDWRNRGCAPS